MWNIGIVTGLRLDTVDQDRVMLLVWPVLYFLDLDDRVKDNEFLGLVFLTSFYSNNTVANVGHTALGQDHHCVSKESEVVTGLRSLPQDRLEGLVSL